VCHTFVERVRSRFHHIRFHLTPFHSILVTTVPKLASMGVVLTRAEVVKGLEPLATYEIGDVRVCFNTFEELCPTPALWEASFAELFAAFSSADAAARAFGVLDTDTNGLLDAYETFAGLALISKGHLTERMKLLFDIFDLNKEGELHFDECFFMLRRSMLGLRKMTSIVTPPEKVVHNMTKHIFKSATKHRNASITAQDWFNWWSCDSSIRSALKMVTWRPEDQRGLPTPDRQLTVDYTKGAVDEDRDVVNQGFNPKTLGVAGGGRDGNAGKVAAR